MGNAEYMGITAVVEKRENSRSFKTHIIQKYPLNPTSI